MMIHPLALALALALAPSLHFAAVVVFVISPRLALRAATDLSWRPSFRSSRRPNRLPCRPALPLRLLDLPAVLFSCLGGELGSWTVIVIISLRPLVEELKTVRKQCMEIENEYQEKRGAHEKVGCVEGGGSSTGERNSKDGGHLKTAVIT